MTHTASRPFLCLASVICAGVCATALFGAQATDARTASPTALASSMVLSGREAGSGFTRQQQAFTPAQLARQGTWTLAQLQTWGYEGGFERVFDRDLATTDAEQIASDAGVYRTAAGATQSLIANGNECTVGPWQVLPVPKHLGDQAVFCAQTGTEHGLRGELFFLVWRVGRFKGSISLSGLINHVNAATAVALARLQVVKM